MPEFYVIFDKKNNKMTEFYMIFARKIFFPIFFGGREGGQLLPASRLLRLCTSTSRTDRQTDRQIDKQTTYYSNTGNACHIEYASCGKSIETSKLV